MQTPTHSLRVALIEAGSPGLNIYSQIAMGRGAAMLATVACDAGHEVRAFVEDVSGKGSVDWDFVREADVVGFSTITCTLSRTAELVAEVRRANPTAVVVLGGPEPTCATERAFEAGADYVIRGEAELSFLAFLRALGERDPLTRHEAIRTVEGICWRENGILREGPPVRQLTRDEVCALPIIDNSLVLDADKRTTGLVWRSRGCPQRCDFCEVCEIWPRYVLRDEETSVEELMHAQDEPCDGVFLIDDNAAANKPSFKRFLRSAIERGYRKPIVVQMRADAAFDRDGRLDRELLRMLRDIAPFTIVCVGVESASDESLAEVNKRVDATRMARALKAMRRYGLLVHGMMIAFATDTRDTLHRNGDYARRYLSTLQYLFETPLPGTKRTAEHEREGRIMWREVAELKFLDGMHVALRPLHMSPREMQELVAAEYQRFYSKARIIGAFLGGLFLRYRLLSPAQRAYLRQLRPLKRLRVWFRYHLDYKFAPWALLLVGRRRVQEFMRDAEYAAYLEQLEG